MKRFLEKALVLQKWLLLFLLPLPVKMEDEYCRLEDNVNTAMPFRLLHKDVCSLTKNVLLEKTFENQNHCAMKCMPDPFCAGYNFKKKELKKPNCQLTHTLSHKFNSCSKDNKGWNFYHPVAPRKVPCNKMKNCKNGGKTIIDLKDGPGSDPYRCECSKGYKGKHCEIDIDECSMKSANNCHLNASCTNTIGSYVCQCRSGYFGDGKKCTDMLLESVILSGESANYTHLLSTWMKTGGTWKTCWRATGDGWEGTKFHSKCDNISSTVTIVKVRDYIFGGFANNTWTPTSPGFYFYKKAPGSFIFSFINKEKLPPFKSPLKDQNTESAIWTGPGHGPTFGFGGDLHIYNNATFNTNSFTKFNNDYQPPSGVSDASTILAGTRNFTPSEVEVFYLV